MHRSARRGQQLDTFASALASMAVFTDAAATNAELEKAAPHKWRETVSDVDERDGEEGESEDDAKAAGKWSAKAAARQRGSGGRSLHVVTQAAGSSSNNNNTITNNSNREPQSAYWRLFGSATGRPRNAQQSVGFGAYRKAFIPREDSADSRRRADRSDPPSSTDDGSDDAAGGKERAATPAEKRDPDEEVVLLREQVALLVQNLEKEKQRRTVEQNLMQTVSRRGRSLRRLPVVVYRRLTMPSCVQLENHRAAGPDPAQPAGATARAGASAAVARVAAGIQGASGRCRREVGRSSDGQARLRRRWRH